MPGFRDLPLRIAYTSSDRPLETFYIPVLSHAVRYDRVAGYFSSGALVAAAQGLAHLIRAGGTMRLLVGAALSEDDVAAIQRGETSVEDLSRDRLIQLLEEPTDALARQRFEALAWMVAVGTLQIRVVLPLDENGRPLAGADSEAYFHAKWGVLTDRAGDRVAFQGSINESLAAWRLHYEAFNVFCSWVEGDAPQRVVALAERFERLWLNREPGWISIPVPEAVRERLLTFRPDEPPETDPLEAPAQPPSPPDPREAVVAAYLRDAPFLLGAGQGLGRATAAVRPWPHQLRLAEEVVGRFPDRYLLADEVGLGKTIEVGLVLRDLLLSGAVRRALILAPASVLRQWQEELREKIALEVEIFDGARFVGPPPDRIEREPRTPNPFDDAAVLLCSSQLAKRRDRRQALLTAERWDLVVLDEAHHARRKGFQDLAARRPNRLLELLEGTDGLDGLAAKTRGLLLVTATPMQVHPAELWDLLLQLGLPGPWSASPDDFLRYFRELQLAGSRPDDVDWRFLARMARAEVEFGGPPEEQVERALRPRLGSAGWARLRDFPRANDPRAALRKMDAAEREELVRVLRHLTPLRRRMFRHTRDLLRHYRSIGLLTENVPSRAPEPRWIEMTDEERELYERVEHYISRYYKKYEDERKGLGFIMTVYRRRLTSSFRALERSLERRLAHLLGRRPDLGLQDEDIEEADLTEDVSEELDGQAARAMREIQEEEVAEVEEFLAALRGLAHDSKFDYLLGDLERALTKRDQVLIFTQYADTMDDLKERLRPMYGRHLACYSGRGGERWTGSSWEPVSKEVIKGDFERGDIKILLGTDALAEGLNLQTCGVEINYDAPWNPMRLEQRIGRIDRIGQRHDTVWIWTYFYEGTVEADVYRRLGDRIDLFELVVGPLQPILQRVERTIRDLALTDPAQRAAMIEEALGALESEIDAVKSGGLELDVGFQEATAPRSRLEAPVTLSELEGFLTASRVGRYFRPHPEIPRAYRVEVDGRDVAVTFDPAVADAHPERLRLLTFGDRLLERLLEELVEHAESANRVVRLSAEVPAVVRLSTEDVPRRFVAWYTFRDGAPRPIERLAELRAALEVGAPGPSGWEEEAAERFAGDVTRWLEVELDGERRRAREHLSAIQERGRRLLARATYLWLARTIGPGGAVPRIGEETVRDMLQRSKYPFSALARLVEQLPEVSADDPGWAAVATKDPRQLDGLWQAAQAQGRRLVEELATAVGQVEALDRAEPPVPRVAARLW